MTVHRRPAVTQPARRAEPRKRKRAKGYVWPNKAEVEQEFREAQRRRA